MTKTRRKFLKSRAKQTRTDHAIGCRVSPDELATVDADIANIKQESDIELSRGGYVKHALLNYPKARSLIAAMKFYATLETADGRVLECLRTNGVIS